MFIKVLGVETALSGQGTFGQVSGGIVRLQCTHLIECPVLMDYSEHFPKTRFARKKIRLDVYWDYTPGKKMKVYFLPILEESGIQGLFLESVEGNGKGCFRRVGFFFLLGEADAGYFYEAAAMPENVPDESKYEEKAGADENGNDLYVISII